MTQCNDSDGARLWVALDALRYIAEQRPLAATAQTIAAAALREASAPALPGERRDA